MNEMLAIAGHAAERGQWWPDTWIGRIWIIFGLGAQLVFTARFLVQWIASERRGKSYVPIVFWYLSIVGALMLFTYAVVWKHDPVIAAGQATGGFIYVRNLMLVNRERKLQGETVESLQEGFARPVHRRLVRDPGHNSWGYDG